MKKTMTALALAASASAATAAPIGFTGAYDYSTWTITRTTSTDPTQNNGSGGSSSVSNNNQTLTLVEPNGGNGANGYTFSHSVLQTGTLSFNWLFNGQADACCSGFNVYVNNVVTNVANNSFHGHPYAGALLSGFFSTAITAGDVFRFQQYSSDSCCGASFTTITNFDVVGVPEPAMLGLFGLGFAGLGVARRRRKSV